MRSNFWHLGWFTYPLISIRDEVRTVNYFWSLSLARLTRKRGTHEDYLGDVRVIWRWHLSPRRLPELIWLIWLVSSLLPRCHVHPFLSCTVWPRRWPSAITENPEHFFCQVCAGSSLLGKILQMSSRGPLVGERELVCQASKTPDTSFHNFQTQLPNVICIWKLAFLDTCFLLFPP